VRIIFIGAVEFSRRALERLIANGANVVGVCTLKQPAVIADHVDLSDICRERGIPWTYAPDVGSDEIFTWTAEKQPDVVFCFGWSRLLDRRLLELGRLGAVGYHPAALPANRGRHPIIWALALGLRETASTFFFMTEEADAGDILSQERIDIEEGDDAGTLYDKVTRAALSQIDRFTPQLQSGSFPRVAQDHRCANIWRKRRKADGQIDWRMSARSIHNLVRALTRPYIGAHFLHGGEEIKLWRSEVVNGGAPNIEPGKVLGVTPRGPVVKCGDGALLLVSAEPAITVDDGDYL
jgi:methionyl-tRNA formyltransferase